MVSYDWKSSTTHLCVCVFVVALLRSKCVRVGGCFVVSLLLLLG